MDAATSCVVLLHDVRKTVKITVLEGFYNIRIQKGIFRDREEVFGKGRSSQTAGQTWVGHHRRPANLR